MDNQQAESKHNAGNKTPMAEMLVLAGILLAGLLLRGLYLREIFDSPDFSAPMLDAVYHDYWARGIVSGDWTAPADMGAPELRSTPYIRPPGYPYFLALVYLLSGSSFLAARIAQMGLGLVNCVLAYILGRGLFGRAVGLILAGFMSIYWVFIYFEGELLAPVLIIFCALLLINVLGLWTEKFTCLRGIAAGILFGLFTIVRTNVLLFLPAVLGWAWWLRHRRNDGRRFRVVAIGFLISTAVIISPVTLRNYLVADDFVLVTSNIGVNLYAGNNEQANCVSPDITGLKEMAGLGNWTCFTYPEIVHRVGIILGRPVKHSEVSSYFAKRALGYIYGHPLKALGLTLKKAMLFWGPAEISNNKELLCAKQQSVVLRYIPGFPAVVSLFVLGLLRLLFGLKSQQIRDKLPQRGGQRQFEVSVLILLFICTYFVSYLPFFVTARYRAPIIPFLLLFGAYGVYSIGQYIHSKDFRRAVFWTIAWAVLWIVAGRSFIDYEPNWARWYYCRGQAYLTKGQIELAVTEHRRAVQAGPSAPWAHSFLAAALAQQGKLAEAAEHYYHALQVKPDFLKAHFDLAGVLYQQDKIEQAINHWTKVIRLYPNHAEAHNNLAGAFYKLDRIDEAIKHWSEALRLKPDWAEVRDNLNKLMARKKRAAEIAQYTEMLQRNPDDPNTHNKLAALFYRKGDIEQAIEHWGEAVRLKGDWAEVKNNLAWVLATVEDETLRNPARAVELAEGACELTGYKRPEMLDTLGVAYAAAGRFAEAVKTAERAKELAAAFGRKELVSDIEKHLELYKVNKPYSD